MENSKIKTTDEGAEAFATEALFAGPQRKKIVIITSDSELESAIVEGAKKLLSSKYEVIVVNTLTAIKMVQDEEVDRVLMLNYVGQEPVGLHTLTVPIYNYLIVPLPVDHGTRMVTYRNRLKTFNRRR